MLLAIVYLPWRNLCSVDGILRELSMAGRAGPLSEEVQEERQLEAVRPSHRRTDLLRSRS